MNLRKLISEAVRTEIVNEIYNSNFGKSVAQRNSEIRRQNSFGDYNYNISTLSVGHETYTIRASLHSLLRFLYRSNKPNLFNEILEITDEMREGGNALLTYLFDEKYGNEKAGIAKKIENYIVYGTISGYETKPIIDYLCKVVASMIGDNNKSDVAFYSFGMRENGVKNLCNNSRAFSITCRSGRDFLLNANYALKNGAFVCISNNNEILLKTFLSGDMVESKVRNYVDRFKENPDEAFNEYIDFCNYSRELYNKSIAAGKDLINADPKDIYGHISSKICDKYGNCLDNEYTYILGHLIENKKGNLYNISKFGYATLIGLNVFIKNNYSFKSLKNNTEIIYSYLRDITDNIDTDRMKSRYDKGEISFGKFYASVMNICRMPNKDEIKKLAKQISDENARNKANGMRFNNWILTRGEKVVENIEDLYKMCDVLNNSLFNFILKKADSSRLHGFVMTEEMLIRRLLKNILF